MSLSRLGWMSSNIVLILVIALNQSQLNPFTVKNTLNSRMKYAEKMWQSSVAQRHEKIEQHHAGRDMPVFPAADDLFRTYTYTFWDLVPPSYNCPWELERVGSLGDGGKWVCGLSKYVERNDNSTIIYSFGIEQETSFEEEMIKRTYGQIFAFDIDPFNITFSSPDNESRVTFTPIGLGAEDAPDSSPPVMTLKSLMARNNHSYIDILKVDIEGMEFEAMDRVIEDFKQEEVPVGQLMIEVHLLPREKMGPILSWFERLENAGFRPVSVEPNLYALTIQNERTFPRYSEYVWINVRDHNSILLRE